MKTPLVKSGLARRLEPMFDADGLAVFTQATTEPMFINPDHPGRLALGLCPLR